MPNRQNDFLSSFYLFFSQLFKQASSNFVTLSCQFLHKAASYSDQYTTTSLFHNFEVLETMHPLKNYGFIWDTIFTFCTHAQKLSHSHDTNFWTSKLNGFCWTLCKQFHFCSVLWTVDDSTYNSLHIFFMYYGRCL